MKKSTVQGFMIEKEIYVDKEEFTKTVNEILIQYHDILKDLGDE